MTDNEIIQALACCIDSTRCNECLIGRSPIDDESECMGRLIGASYDLIKRQQVEIEMLEGYVNTNCIDCAGCTQLRCDCSNIRTEAIRDFAERLKARYSQADILCPRRIVSLTEKTLDDFVKEMVGDNT